MSTAKDMPLEQHGMPDNQRLLEPLALISILAPRDDDPTDPVCRMGLPVLFWGLSGIGKTERVDTVIHSAGFHAEYCYPGAKTPDSFDGAPCPDGNGGIKVTCILGAARALMARPDGRGVLIIDEASAAPRTTFEAMMSMIHERRVGDDELPPQVRVILTANPPEYVANGVSLVAAGANRFGHFFVGVSSGKEFDNYLNGQLPELPDFGQCEQLVKDNFANEWALLKSSLGKFHVARSGLLHAQPQPDDEAGGFAWPSPRTWKMGVKAIATSRACGMSKLYPDLEAALLQGFVGPSYLEFLHWLKENDLPDPKEVLAGNWKIDKKRLDRTVAVVDAVTNYCLDVPAGIHHTEKNARPISLWSFVGTLLDSGLNEIAVRPGKRLVKHGWNRTHNDPQVKKTCEPIYARLVQCGILKYV